MLGFEAAMLSWLEFRFGEGRAVRSANLAARSKALKPRVVQTLRDDLTVVENRAEMQLAILKLRSRKQLIGSTFDAAVKGLPAAGEKFIDTTARRIHEEILGG